jgi:predicted transposase/invertase (TIGR01784 family)
MSANDSTSLPGKFKGGIPDIRQDQVFKAVFANDKDPKSRKALSGLLSAITGRALAVVTLSQNEPITGFFQEKQIRYDINCELADGTRCNVEITVYPFYCETLRIEYYTAKTHIGQPTKGKQFNEIVRTYQVSIINKSILNDNEYLHVFRFYDSDRYISLGGRITIFTVELPKARKLARSKAVNDMTPAERWAVYFLYNANKSKFGRKLLEEIREKEEGVRMATEVVRGFSPEENLYFQQMSKEKYEVDRFNLIAESENRGRRAERRKANTEIKKMHDELKKTDIELKKANTERASAIIALRAEGVPEEVIGKVYGDISGTK